MLLNGMKNVCWCEGCDEKRVKKKKNLNAYQCALIRNRFVWQCKGMIRLNSKSSVLMNFFLLLYLLLCQWWWWWQLFFLFSIWQQRCGKSKCFLNWFSWHESSLRSSLIDFAFSFDSFFSHSLRFFFAVRLYSHFCRQERDKKSFAGCFVSHFWFVNKEKQEICGWELFPFFFALLSSSGKTRNLTLRENLIWKLLKDFHDFLF